MQHLGRRGKWNLDKVDIVMLKVLCQFEKVWFGCTAGTAVVAVESYYGNVVLFVHDESFVVGNVGDVLDEVGVFGLTLVL